MYINAVISKPNTNCPSEVYMLRHLKNTEMMTYHVSIAPVAVFLAITTFGLPMHDGGKKLIDCSAPGADFIRHPFNCSRWFRCPHQTPIEMSPCIDEMIFSNEAKTCVQKGNKHDDCNENLSVEERCDRGEEIIPHNVECALYYNCSSKNPESKEEKGPEVLECPYPLLFSTSIGKCVHFKEAQCKQRNEPKSPCEYKQNNCNKASQVLPSCVDSPDGKNPHPKHLWTPIYIICDNDRVVGTGLCQTKNESSYVFHPELKKCLSIYQIPVKHGGLKPDCQAKPDGRYPDEIGNCNCFFKCKDSELEMVQFCEEGKVFNVKNRECESKDESCQPCGTLPCSDQIFSSSVWAPHRGDDE